MSYLRYPLKLEKSRFYLSLLDSESLAKPAIELLSYLFGEPISEKVKQDGYRPDSPEEHLGIISMRFRYSYELYFTLSYNYENSKIKPDEFKEFIEASSVDDIKLKEYCSDEKYLSLKRLLNSEYIVNIDKTYENIFSIFLRVAAEPISRDALEQCFLARLLSRQITSPSFKNMKTEKQKDILSNLIKKLEASSNAANKDLIPYLFILRIMYELGFDRNDWDDFLKKVFNSYLDSKNLISDVYFIAILRTFKYQSLLDLLKSRLNADKDLFKLFLEHLISLRKKGDNQFRRGDQYRINKLFYEDNNNQFTTYYIDPMFNDFNALNNFIKSVESWENEDFTKEYFSFIKAFADKNCMHDCLYDFPFQHLSPKSIYVHTG